MLVSNMLVCSMEENVGQAILLENMDRYQTVSVACHVQKMKAKNAARVGGTMFLLLSLKRVQTLIWMFIQDSSNRL